MAPRETAAAAQPAGATNGMALLAQVDAVMIDLDGTLVDTLGDFAQAIGRMLADLQLPPLAAEHIEHMVGKGTEHLLRSVLAHVLAQGGTAATPAAVEALYPRALGSYMRHYLEINGQFARVYPGVASGLQALRARGLRLACLTNKPQQLAVALLRAKGLLGCFDHVFGGDAFERKKPDPLPLVKTCEALGTQPARTLMLGDSSNDAAAAHAAGCPVVLVSYGYNHGQPVRSVAANAYVDSLVELVGA